MVLDGINSLARKNWTSLESFQSTRVCIVCTPSSLRWSKNSSINGRHTRKFRRALGQHTQTLLAESDLPALWRLRRLDTQEIRPRRLHQPDEVENVDKKDVDEALNFVRKFLDQNKESISIRGFVLAEFHEINPNFWISGLRKIQEIKYQP